MSLFLAAVGATAMAIIELTVGPYLWVDGAHPHLVFVFGVIVALTLGLEGGLTWAFVGGIALDVLAGRPLGSTALALLISIGGAWLLASLLGRLRPLAPIIAVGVFGIVNSLIQYLLVGALQGPVPVEDPVAIVLPSAIYNTVVAAVVGPLALVLYDRRLNQERPIQ